MTFTIRLQSKLITIQTSNFLKCPLSNMSKIRWMFNQLQILYRSVEGGGGGGRGSFVCNDTVLIAGNTLLENPARHTYMLTCINFYLYSN